MTHLTGFLPDLHIVSELDLLLLQRGAAAGHPVPPAGPSSPPWPAAVLDSVLDELERRDACPVEGRTAARRTPR
ncbi:hypothetical protein [Arthrobacter sedimenti]|uniref:hypothetical protein n=1 Tax=Arthrobacter sedimenti TaxID=2694931 RepID=UPI000B34CEAF|nr:hypothetical protein [Arthrobacter sedimenti]OUM42659.1 hypothetical protein B8W73_07480 [Arthrobacter agilis]